MPEDATQKIRVAIGGIEYVLRGEATEAHLRSVARSVDNLMQQIAAANPRLDERRIAILTAVNFADEYLRLRDEHRALQTDYEDLLVLLDEKTKAPRPQDSKGVAEQ